MEILIWLLNSPSTLNTLNTCLPKYTLTCLLLTPLGVHTVSGTFTWLTKPSFCPLVCSIHFDFHAKCSGGLGFLFGAGFITPWVIRRPFVPFSKEKNSSATPCSSLSSAVYRRRSEKTNPSHTCTEIYPGMNTCHGSALLTSREIKVHYGIM